MPWKKEEPQPRDPFPVVALGASSGGEEAMAAFFSHWPAGTRAGMAFVLLPPPAENPDRPLATRIAQATPMRVCQAEHGMAVQPDCVFIIPPLSRPAIHDGRLSLHEADGPGGPPQPVDGFFRSLAKALGARAIGVVLAGAGHDGALGVKAIKAEGGMVMAQRPETTAFDEMPRRAAATRQVDYLLAPEAMPAQLLAYAAQAFQAAPPPPKPGRGQQTDRILRILSFQTGHDFSSYRQSTVQQRIKRRMAVAQQPTLGKYIKYLQQTPAEVEALLLDLLVGVSLFFRDPEAFRALEKQVIPRLFSGQPAHATIRVWSPGCSTGEEAYALAMLLAEHQEHSRKPHPIQVFASDIDARAIATARTGLYAASIKADLTPGRLERFFTAEPDGSYKIHRAIRDLVVFSEQDLLKDPPFSRLDLIVCRNLLTHMSDDLQKKLIPLFHYALKPGGRLFLGAGETVGPFGDLFAVVDAKARLYQRREQVLGTSRKGPGREVGQPLTFQPWLPKGSAPQRPWTEEEYHFLHEDLHSVQEELQSSMEELQTSRSELLSANQELEARNGELEARTASLTRGQTELETFLAGSGIAMILLDEAMRILRFTPAARRQVNLIPADAGRPLSHLTTNLAEYGRLVADAQDVLATQEPLAVQVRTVDGSPFLMRIQPCPAPDSRRGGVVITFVEAAPPEEFSRPAPEPDPPS